MNDQLDRYLTAAEAGHFLGLQISTVRRMTAKGELPFCRVTGRRAIRYRLGDLEGLVRLRAEPMRGHK